MSQLLPLLRTALLGTQREALPEPPAGSLQADLMASMAGVEPEAVLLSMAGALHLGEMTGQLPRSVSASSIASQPHIKDVTPCDASSRQRLAAMLDGRFLSVLPEFLLRLDQTEQR